MKKSLLALILLGLPGLSFALDCAKAFPYSPKKDASPEHPWIASFLQEEYCCKSRECNATDKQGESIRHFDLHSLPQANPLVSAQKAKTAQLANLTPEESKDSEIDFHIYNCPNTNWALLRISYGKELYQIIQFHPQYRFTWSKPNLEFPISKAREKALFEYFCSANLKNFFKTRQAPPFHPSVTQEDNSSTASASGQTAPKSTQKSAAKPQKQIPSLKPSSRRAWTVLGIPFYSAPVPGSLHTVRRFENQNKTAELKIQFSGGDKTTFLRRLQARNQTAEPRVTSCPNNISIFEMAQDGLFQAFLIRQDGIAVLTFGYATDQKPPQFTPSQRDEFCTLDITLAY